jgi:hypothetical protein
VRFLALECEQRASHDVAFESLRLVAGGFGERSSQRRYGCRLSAQDLRSSRVRAQNAALLDASRMARVAGDEDVPHAHLPFTVACLGQPCHPDRNEQRVVATRQHVGERCAVLSGVSAAGLVDVHDDAAVAAAWSLIAQPGVEQR